MVKARPQILQANGFSPVWVLSWICRALEEEKHFPQVLQKCCFGVLRGGAAESTGDVEADDVTKPGGMSLFSWWRPWRKPLTSGLLRGPTERREGVGLEDRLVFEGSKSCEGRSLI